MKKIRKLISLIISVLLLGGSFVITNAAVYDTKLLSVYMDSMLFSGNKEAVIEGTGNPGDTIYLNLYSSDNEIIESAATTVNQDGRFVVSFMAPESSFEEYKIVLYVNGTEFAALKNILFGELWLASGQSNMQYPLAQSRTGQQMFSEGMKLSKYLRVLMVPAYPSYNGSTSIIPSEPQNDIVDAIWVNGENTEIYSMSAVAYFFAEKLMSELNVPVGILNSSLGGSALRSWLSREAIDSDSEVKQYLKNIGEYIEADDWYKSERNIYQDITANYNQKIAPLKNFRPTGMIWYQGETDLMIGNTQYDKQFDLMQKTYTELFNHSDGLLPIIYTQLASYQYSDDNTILSEWNINYTKMQARENNSRAVISIYDIPLTYLPEAGLIHPQCKEEVGERMAVSALGLVHKKYSSYTAATPEKIQIKDDGIYVTFTDIGKKLTCPEKTLEGFSVCGSDGIYVSAGAEIVSDDTVRIFSDYVSDFCGASYAYTTNNGNANLYSEYEDGTLFPVSMFMTDSSLDSHFWHEKSWADCDEGQTWFTENDTFSGFYDTWKGNNAEITVNEENMLETECGLGIKANRKCFSVSPTLTYKDGIKTKSFSDVDTDYSDYGKMSFLIRNNGNNDIIFEGVKFYTNSVTWYSPEIEGTLDCAMTIPADGQIHRITLDLNRLYHLGNECSLSYDNEKIDSVTEIEFDFSSDSSGSDISIDSISFSPTSESFGTRYDVNVKNADNPIEYFTGIVLYFVGIIAALFNL
ncbi:MAG: hypothetical protein IKL47_11615 [Clostridia bacterium]|nr:hypothetical protein [Clostridia bacterium]